MAEFKNPYHDQAKKPVVSDEARHLANYMVAFLGLKVTDTQREAFATSIDVLLNANPWVLDVPVMKLWLK